MEETRWNVSFTNFTIQYLILAFKRIEFLKFIYIHNKYIQLVLCCSLLDKVRELSKQLGKPTDPYNDDSAAAFYRLPAGFRRAQKYQQKEEAGTDCLSGGIR